MIETPFFPNPLTDFSFLLAPKFRCFPNGNHCSKIERKLLDCFEAYGIEKGRSKCAELVYDMIECNNSTLQTQRQRAIQKERMRQYRAGKLDKPFEEYPPLDSYLYL